MSQTTKELQPIDQVRSLLNQLRPQLEMALPAVGLTADRLIRIALTSCQKTPKLLECDRKSLLAAIVQCAQVGLVPDGVTGEAYLIPYAGVVQFQLGYKGIAVLVRRSGEIETFLPQVVYEGDTFDYNLAEARILKHERTPQTAYGRVTHFYDIVRYKSGHIESLIMTAAEVDHVRDNFSKAYQSAVKFKKEDESIWELHYEAMGMKTLMRKHAKYLPIKTDDAKIALAADEGAESGIPQNLGSLLHGQSEAPTDTAPPAQPQIREPQSTSGKKTEDIPFGE